MAGIDGTYDVVVKSPLGDQKSTLTVRSEGATFTGTNAGALGSDTISGAVSGDTLRWKQQISVPMPMTLDMAATVEGDAISGTVSAGAFGSFALSGTRVG